MSEWEPAVSLLNAEGVTSNNHTPSSVEDLAPYQNTQKSGKNKSMVMGHDGPETKYYAG
jgi:hypothetical protein